jgi:Zn-dependent peptidase ImmA (M78 family)
LRNGKNVQGAEEIAREYRKRLGVDHLQWLDPMTILMKLRCQIPGVDFATVDPFQIKPALAKWDSSCKLIRIGSDTFAAANGPQSDGHARFSVFHEIIHALGGDEGQLNRLHSRSEIPSYARRLRALESNTDRVTAAFMAPRHLIPDGWMAREVAFFFGMSVESAKIRIEEIRGRARIKRTLPDSVTQLLLDLKKGSRG